MRRAVWALFVWVCVVAPVTEGQVEVVVQWAVKSKEAVGAAVQAIQDTGRLQRALVQALSEANMTNPDVRVRNVTGRMLDTRAPPAADTDTTSRWLETNTGMVAAIGGLTLVGMAWVMRSRPWSEPQRQAGTMPFSLGCAPVIKVRLPVMKVSRLGCASAVSRGTC